MLGDRVGGAGGDTLADGVLLSRSGLGGFLQRHADGLEWGRQREPERACQGEIRMTKVKQAVLCVINKETRSGAASMP
jgi:hypothetical protein